MSLTTIAPRLRRLVLLLSSNQRGEVAAAAAAIDRTLKSAGADWHVLADELLPEHSKAGHTSDSSNPPEDRRAMRVVCLVHSHLLRTREKQFLDDLERWRGNLTEKQLAWLHSIYSRITAANR
jgi:hypothetical protein